MEYIKTHLKNKLEIRSLEEQKEQAATIIKRIIDMCMADLTNTLSIEILNTIKIWAKTGK